ncbi:MAG: molybdopterin-guanine dinucleotide biosynthesis protein B [Chloroflexi bacterium RBG_16_56_11]|nr:MAG: molybdopterin-guanine dinucleotide biosynthesis protein B [Chloroflexi bacterium RBG_16_56_11]HJX13989.1 molybdopterin-guanine dinucleotide biosynthesis protein B [Dehalococcoidales bacterium]
MRSIISFVGKSSSGKTTLLESLIAELKKRGYRVAIVKHSHHADDLDKTSKDTWRFTQAGSALSAINSLDHLAIYRRIDHYFDPQEISNFILWDYDLILTEGFKGSDYPKIEVHRGEQGKELLTDPEKLVAVVTDQPLDIGVPQYSHEDVGGIADLLEKTIVERRRETDIDLVVNGEYIPLDPALRDLLSRTLAAMIPYPGGDGVVKSLHISLRRNA